MTAQGFADAWQLFAASWVTGWLCAVFLAVAGVLVVARGHAFLGAAVAQTSTLGVAFALLLGAAHEHDPGHALDSEAVLTLTAVAFAVGAAVLTGAGGTRRAAGESATVWLYLTSASLTVLVVANHPRGAEEVHHLLGSSVLGASAADLGFAAALAALTAVLAGRYRDALALFALDPGMAAAAGLRPRSLSLAASAWVGLCIGFAIHSSGLLYAFGCLVLPALAAARLCRTVRAMLWVAPLLALCGTVGGFLLAHVLDLPPGQLAVAALALLVALAALARRCRRA